MFLFIILYFIFIYSVPIIPFSARYGTSAASQGPSYINKIKYYILKKLLTAKAKACAIPYFGLILAQSGANCMTKHIFPHLYIFGVFPSNSGNSYSIGVAGYIAGISNYNLNTYF